MPVGYGFYATGGVGINLAIQGAVATANIVAAPLRQGHLTTEHLRMVQQRRTLPMRIIQSIQLAIEKRVTSRVLGASRPHPRTARAAAGRADGRSCNE